MKKTYLSLITLLLAVLCFGQKEVNTSHRFVITKVFSNLDNVRQKYETSIPEKLSEQLDKNFLIVQGDAIRLIDYRSVVKENKDFITSETNASWNFYNYRIEGKIYQDEIQLSITRFKGNTVIKVSEEWNSNRSSPKKLETTCKALAEKVMEKFGVLSGIKNTKLAINSNFPNYIIKINNTGEGITLDNDGKQDIPISGKGSNVKMHYTILDPNKNELKSGSIQVWSKKVNRFRLNKNFKLKPLNYQFDLNVGGIISDNIHVSSSANLLYNLAENFSIGIGGEFLYVPYTISYDILNLSSEEIKATTGQIFGNLLAQYQLYLPNTSVNLFVRANYGRNKNNNENFGIKASLGTSNFSSLRVDLGYKKYEIPTQQILFNEFGNAEQIENITKFSGIYIGVQLGVNF